MRLYHGTYLQSGRVPALEIRATNPSDSSEGDDYAEALESVALLGDLPAIWLAEDLDSAEPYAMHRRGRDTGGVSLIYEYELRDDATTAVVRFGGRTNRQIEREIWRALEGGADAIRLVRHYGEIEWIVLSPSSLSCVGVRQLHCSRRRLQVGDEPCESCYSCQCGSSEEVETGDGGHDPNGLADFEASQKAIAAALAETAAMLDSLDEHFVSLDEADTLEW